MKKIRRRRLKKHKLNNSNAVRPTKNGNFAGKKMILSGCRIF
jgi:hypothetical protein